MPKSRDRAGKTGSSAGPEKTGRLKILEVVGICGGGLARHIRSLCRDAVHQGHSVTVAYVPHGVDPAFQRFAAAWREEIHFVPLQVSREVSLTSDLKGALGLLRLIRSAGPFDVVHGHSAKGGALARITGLLSGTPTVYTPHSLIASSPEIPRGKAIVYNWIERILGHLATSRMITVSEGERALVYRLRLAPRGRVVCIPNGLEEEDLWDGAGHTREEDLRHKPLTFGTTLRFSAQKAPMLLIEAFTRLERTLPGLPMKLLIAGDGELFDEVEREVHRSGMGDKISLLGWSTDTKATMQEFDVFVLPSLYEGFSYSLLEAMAARLPVVATAVFGVDEAVSRVPSNVLVPPGDADALAEGMKRVLTMAEPKCLRQSLQTIGVKNRDYVQKHFRQAEISHRTIGLYRSLSKGAAGR